MATAKKKTTTKSTSSKETVSEVDSAPIDDATTAEVIVTEDIPILEQPELKKTELLAQVVERSGIKKKDAKPALEAALDILGEAIAQGRELNLQPMGKIKFTRMKKVGNGTVSHARVRQPMKVDKPETDDVAENAAETTVETSES